MDPLERMQQKAREAIRNMTNEERLKELCLFCLEKKRLRGDAIRVFKYIRGYHQEEGCELFCLSAGESTRSQGHELRQGRFLSDAGTDFSALKLVEQGEIPEARCGICHGRI